MDDKWLMNVGFKEFWETSLSFSSKSSSLDVILTELETTKNLGNYSVSLQVLVAKAMATDPTKESFARYLAERRFAKVFPPDFVQRLSDSHYYNHGKVFVCGLDYMRVYHETKLVYYKDESDKKVHVNAVLHKTTECTEYTIQNRIYKIHRSPTQHQGGPQPSTSSFRGFTNKRKLLYCTFYKRAGHVIETCYRFRGQVSKPQHNTCCNCCNCGNTCHSTHYWKYISFSSFTYKRPTWNPKRKTYKSENRAGNRASKREKRKR